VPTAKAPLSWALSKFACFALASWAFVIVAPVKLTNLMLGSLRRSFSFLGGCAAVICGIFFVQTFD